MRKLLFLLLISLGVLTQMSAQTVYEQQFSSASSINDFTIFHNGAEQRTGNTDPGISNFGITVTPMLKHGLSHRE